MRTPRGNISFNQTGRDPKAAMSQGAPRSNKMSRYKISKDLDSTVTADFHLARNVKKDENVLMKILKKNYYTLEECKANKEVQICLKLNHKNVLKFVEFINDNNQLLMIFEYLPDNAKGVLKKRGVFSESETKATMLQVFSGLSYIHSQGIVHRNIRPESLACSEDGAEVKIADFSMARSTQDPLSVVSDYSAVQPNPYLAPEILLQIEKYGTPVDIWAAGCVMAELLTGTPLFQGDQMDTKDLMSKICVAIGTLTKSEWQEGTQALRQAMFNLPKVDVGRGLGDQGNGVSPNAKGLIMDMLVWNPGKRKTADKAIRNEFFKSDGEFVNPGENQEILKHARSNLQTWRDFHEADFTKSSLSEFDKIMAEIYATSDNRKQRNANFQGFESSNPLLGDSTPRGRWGGPQPQAKLGVKGGSDDPFGQFRPQRLQTDKPRTSAQNPFADELNTREEVRRPRPAAMQSTLFGPADDSGKGPADLQGRAEKLKQSNPNKFKDRYGNDFMRSQLGGNQQQQADTNGISTPQGRRVSMHNRDPVRSRQPSRVPSNNSLLNGMRISQADAHYAPPVGENQQSPMDEMTDPYSQSRGSQQNGNDPFMQGQARQQNGNDPSMQGQARQQNGHDQFTQNEISGNRPSNNPEWLESNNQHNTNTLPPVHNGNDVTSRPQRRRFADGDDEKYMSIDHTAKAMKLKETNPIKYKDKYGDNNMRLIMGDIPTRPLQISAQMGNRQQNGVNGEGQGQYMPSWAERGGQSRQF
ncbi:uncharacterized protein LOC128214713 [Mya arenaria]|uniref:uncharacterized protein LOC128214713 n=1 Tax=Mya arenaria TaxID=6604 RepID=UPI0022E5C41B|nr:uncharacterized protein LOC128214713 [Mya arenaria]